MAGRQRQRARRFLFAKASRVHRASARSSISTAGSCRYRREVFDHERFDEALSGYGYKEDIDLSYRVFKRGYTLAADAQGALRSSEERASRMSSHQLQRMNLANQFYLHRKNMPQDSRHKAALWWALFGLFLLFFGKAVADRDRGLVTGLIAGAVEQSRGRGPGRPGARIHA